MPRTPAAPLWFPLATIADMSATETNPWRRVSRRVAYENPWLELYHDEVVRPYHYTLAHYSWKTPEGCGRFDEEPEAASRRELSEETGYSGGEWRELCRADLSNSVTDEVAVLFVASGLEAGPASPEGTEQLQLRWVAFDEAMAMIRRGEVTDAMTIIGLQAVALERATRSEERRVG